MKTQISTFCFQFLKSGNPGLALSVTNMSGLQAAGQEATDPRGSQALRPRGAASHHPKLTPPTTI